MEISQIASCTVPAVKILQARKVQHWQTMKLLGKKSGRTSGRQQKRGVTTEQALAMLRKKGIEVDEKQAEIILDFLYILGKLAVNQYFDDD